MGVCSKLDLPRIFVSDLALPRHYGLVILTGVGSHLLNLYFANQIMKARKEHKVEYPDIYSATDKHFNCIQRGHQNYLETLPHFLMYLFIGGLHAPRLCAAGGMIYLAGRAVYFKGYATGDPTKRQKGAFGYLGGVALMVSTIMLGIRHSRLSFGDRF